MGHIAKRGSSWQATWRDLVNRERTKTFARRVDAERFLVGIEADKLKGSYVDPAAGRVTFAEFAREWAARQPWSEQTAIGRRANIENHLIPDLGDIPLARLRPSHVQAWRRGRQQLLSDGTVALLVQILRSILNAAVADQLIGSSPARQDDFRHRPDEVTIPYPEEIVALADAIPQRYKAALWMVVGSGLRQGELFGLTKDRIDFLRRTARVDRQLLTLPNQAGQWGPTKNRVVRVVPVASPTLDALAAHLAAFPAVCLACGGAEDDHGVPGSGAGPRHGSHAFEGLVFSTEDARPVTRNNAGHIWRRSAARAGFRPGTRSGWHLLRHYYASTLIRRGLSPVAVAKRLGDTPKTVMATYAHLFHDDDERTRRAVEEAWSEAFAGLLRKPGDNSRGHFAGMEG